MQDAARLAHFKELVLTHLDAAYNLARWLTRDEFGAEEAVQDACLRAYQAFGSMQGSSPRAWLMAIVRNTCYDWLRGNRMRLREDSYEDDIHGIDHTAPSAEADAMQASEANWVRRCIALLPPEYREVIVLRELEDLSYKEISAIVDIPIGTVMSRLARGRDLLQQRMADARVRRQS
jgi:RNA polymerase sigma-70 factor (ECF subfamily)